MDEFFEDGTGTFDAFVKKTRIGTKCTACLIDLDVHLDTVFKKKRDAQINIKRFSNTEPSKLLAFKTFTDSGFCLPKDVASTIVSLQNYDQCFEDKNPAIDFRYHIIVFSEAGNLIDTFKGQLSRNNSVVLEVSRKLDATKSGWFILKLRGLSNGHFGTMRPQVLFKSGNWVASYHTQPHSMASCYGYRSGVAVKVSKSGSNASFHILNASRRKNQISVQLLKHTDLKPVSLFKATLKGSASAIYSFNDIVTEMPNIGIYNVLINSKFPTRKHIINKMNDGSHSVDHFPN